MTVPPIRIPEGLLPSDGRFGSGPTKVRPESVRELAALATTYLGTSHRQAGVRDTVNRLRAGLAELFALPDGYEVLLGNGGASAFWDAAAYGLIERKSQHLSFGEFSSKFAQVVAGASHLDPPAVIESRPGTHPIPVVDPTVDAYAFTHNETSTGVTMKVRRPHEGQGLVLVDATSAAGALTLDVRAVDVYYFSPQKAFGSDGGLWVALCSGSALDRIERIAASGRAIPSFLNLKTAVDNSRKNQTYNTPSLATLFLMVRQVEWMLENGGLEWAAARCKAHASVLYGWAERVAYATPFVADPALRSPVTGTIDLVESLNAATVSAVLRANGIVDTESYRKLRRNQVRIGMWPATETPDVEALTRAIDYVVSQLG